MKRKRFYCSCVGQAVLNPHYFKPGYQSFRVEIYDRKGRKDGYAAYEASFLVPEEKYEALYELFDGWESDVLPRISWDHFEYAGLPGEKKKKEKYISQMRTKK